MDQAASFLDAWAVTAADQAAIMLILDEIASNIIRSAWPAGGTHQFSIVLTMQAREGAGQIELETVDDGAAFDPTAAPAPDVTLGIDEREPGGLGLFLVREMSDSMQYCRQGGLNRLRITKRLQPSAPAA
jgi:anti-sigma regulatory factor (Ser/Thr protein kinase)